MKKPTVFICRDHALDPVLDQISKNLAGSGVEVIRGPGSTLGQVLQYDPETFEVLFSQAQVAMFSSRSRCSRSVLKACGHLHGIVNPTIGTETIDLSAANEMGILIGHGAVPENYESIAESAVMLLLTLMYQLHAVEDVMRGVRPKPAPGAAGALGRMVKGSTIGLIGFGQIGQAIASRLEPFGARVLANSRSLSKGNAAHGVKGATLETLLSESDAIIVAVAINSSSHKIINAQTLTLMKPGAFIVNIARGEAIDEAALVAALASGKIAGAALDTFEVEPLPQTSALRKFRNVILTPHMVGHSQEVYEAVVPAALENIYRLIAGKPPLYLRNPEALEAFRLRLHRLSRETVVT